MRKSDVPLVGKALTYYIAGSFFLLGYVTVLIEESDVRPGVVEAVLGAIVGLLAGTVIGSLWVKQLPRLAQETARRPWMKWVSLFGFPTPPLRADFKHRLITLAVSFGAFFTSYFILEELAQLWPDLGWPWARFGDSPQTDRVYASVPSTMFVWLLVTGVILAVKGIRWYNSLPD
jgi:hypothetical protein